MASTSPVMDLPRSWWRDPHELRGSSRHMPQPAALGMDDLPHGVGRLPAAAGHNASEGAP
ncbi:MAG: hypothetical protein FWG56_12195 [Desulfovibrionaceae bacterium]|jgi:hypothetical protein|nr:hypothetical protein [Desulfovibrionaceae bacterium]